MLLLYCIATALNAMGWTSVPIVADELIVVYPSLSTLEVNMASTLYMIMYIPVNFVANYFIDKYGARTGLLIGCVLTIIGLWLRILINKSFIYVLLGTGLSAVAQPFILNMPSKVSAQWFGENERAISTTLGTNANTLGAGIGFIFPGYWVSSTAPTSDQFYQFLFWQALVSSVLLLPVILFF